MARDRYGAEVDPRDVLDDDERRDYERSRRNHPSRRRQPRLHILPTVDEDGIDADGWEHGADYPRRDDR